jgi:hypothetical protein
MTRRAAAIGALVSCALVPTACSYNPSGTHVSSAPIGHFRGAPDGVKLPLGAADLSEPIPVVARGPRPDTI